MSERKFVGIFALETDEDGVNSDTTRITEVNHLLKYVEDFSSADACQCFRARRAITAAQRLGLHPDRPHPGIHEQKVKLLMALAAFGYDKCFELPPAQALEAAREWLRFIEFLSPGHADQYVEVGRMAAAARATVYRATYQRAPRQTPLWEAREVIAREASAAIQFLDRRSKKN